MASSSGVGQSVRRIVLILGALTLIVGMAIAPRLARALPKPAEVVSLSDAQLQAPARADEPLELQVRAEIMPGWHINSNHPLSSYYIPTRLSVTAPAPLQVIAISYPPSQRITPSFSNGEALAVFTDDVTFSAQIARGGASPKPDAPIDFAVALDYQACNDVQCLRPVTIRRTFTLSWPLASGASSITPADSGAGAGASDIFSHHGLWLGFLLVLLGGLALNLTPCVYPLIGVTIAYFGNQGSGGTRRVLILALLYVAGIAITFSIVGTVAALSGGLFGAMLENPWVLGAIAAVLLLLAASSFGYFSLQPPAWMMRRVAAARPGFLGSLAMGLGMGVVAAPCIGPFVLGLLLVVERSGKALFGLAVFFVLAVGMGIPYIALALAAGSIRSLPRSGEWLAWVEHLFGFILIGLALYFLDPLLPSHIGTRILPFYAVAVGLYMGFLSPIGRGLRAFQVIKLAVGALSVIALLYLVKPGHPQAPLAFAEFSQSWLAQATEHHQPVIVDFSAAWCVPCREMDATTFKNPAVVREARRFLALRADLTHSSDTTDKIITRYSIQGVPTMLLINSEGKVQKKLVGYVGAEAFLHSLRAIN